MCFNSFDLVCVCVLAVATAAFSACLSISLSRFAREMFPCIFSSSIIIGIWFGAVTFFGFYFKSLKVCVYRVKQPIKLEMNYKGVNLRKEEKRKKYLIPQSHE